MIEAPLKDDENGSVGEGPSTAEERSSTPISSQSDKN